MQPQSQHRTLDWMKRLLLLLICCPGLTHSIAQDTLRLSLEQVLTTVEQSHPAIGQYADRIQGLSNQAEGTRSLMAPQLSVGLNRFPYQTNVLKEKDSPMNQAGIMITGEQMFTNPAKRSRKRDYLLSLATVEQDKAFWTKNQLRLQAKRYYYQRYVAERKLQQLRENENVLALLIQTAKQKYTYNQADLSTVFKAEARLAELENMRAMLLSEIAQSSIGLNTLMNQPPDVAFRIDTLLLIPANFLVAPDTALSGRHDLLAMENSIRSMQLNQRFMAASRKPDFGMRVEHMQMFGMPNQYSLMGMLTIPFAPWSAPMYKSEVKAMGFEIEAMRKEKQTMELMARQMVAEKQAMYRYEAVQWRAYQSTILPAYQKNFDAGLLAYRQNTGSFFVLLDAWEMLLMKRLAYWDQYGSLLQLQAEIAYELEKS